MAALKISAFAGIAPRVGVALLKENEAETAINTKLYSGELRAWNQPNDVTGANNIAVNALSIYKHRNSSAGDLWLSWTTDVNVVPSPIFDTGENPIYYTGSGTPKKTNSSLSETGSAPFPGDYYEMGVPAPTVAPTVSAAGGSGAAESRVYLYTFISTFGTIQEESAPSPASSVLSVLPGGTVTVSGLGTTAPAGDYNITTKRIYRAVSGTSTTIYLKVADVAIGTASYSDTTTATQLGGALESSSYNPPPTDLQGISSMANGILVGFRENEIYFSEPYVPHAWPAEYSLTVEYPIVGIGCFGESVVVATQGNPFVISGSTPRSMSQAKIPLFEPCVSKRSIVSDDTGVMYASPNGIVKIAQGFAGLATNGLFTRDEWQRKKPTTMLGAILDGAYYLFWEDVTTSIQRCLILDRNEVASALTETSVYTEAVFVDPTSAQLYFSTDNKIHEWEGNANSFLSYEWLSKLFIFPRPLNFSALQVEANFEDVDLANALIAENAAIVAANLALFTSGADLMGALNAHVVNGMYVNGSLMSEPPDNVSSRFIQISIYCGGILVSTKQITDRKTYRLPSGFKGDRWQFKVTGNVPIKSIKFAETAKELAES